MITLRFDTLSRKLVNSTGEVDNTELRIAYQEAPVWEIIFGVADRTAGTFTPIDVSAAVAWKAAVDDDFNHDTDPMVRTLNADIDSSSAGSGIIVVSMDANTATFLAAVADKDELRTVKFDLSGLNASLGLAYYAKFAIVADNTLDPSGGDPPEPVGNYYTKTEVDALLPAVIAPVEISGDTTLTAVTGEKIWIVDTSGDDVELALEASSTNWGFRPVAVKIAAANSLIFVPDGAETINGVAGPYAITVVDTEVRLYPVTGGWRCAIPSIP